MAGKMRACDRLDMVAQSPPGAAAARERKPGFLTTTSWDLVTLAGEVAVMSVKVSPRPKSISRDSKKKTSSSSAYKELKPTASPAGRGVWGERGQPGKAASQTRPSREACGHGQLLGTV